jgi:hypothetical protein
MKINDTTGKDAWCVKGMWKKWDDMTPEEKSAKMAAKKAIREACGEKENWKYNDKEYPAYDVRLVQVNATVGSGMSTRTIISGHRIAVISPDTAEPVMRDNPPGRVYEVGTAQGCPERGLVRGIFRGLPAIQEHAGHGHWRTIAIIGYQGMALPERSA